MERDIQLKLRILKHVEQIGDVGKTCRYFGVGRASSYRWKVAFARLGGAGLANRKAAPKNPANRTTPEIGLKGSGLARCREQERVPISRETPLYGMVQEAFRN